MIIFDTPGARSATNEMIHLERGSGTDRRPFDAILAGSGDNYADFAGSALGGAKTRPGRDFLEPLAAGAV